MLKMRKKERHFSRALRSAIINGAIACVLAGLYMAAFKNPATVEQIYSRGVYQGVSTVLSAVFGLFSFSVGEILIYIFAAGLAVFIIVTLVRFIKNSGYRLRTLAGALLRIIAVAASLISVFLVFWGFNYAREPVANTLGLEISPAPPETLKAVCMELSVRANALRQILDEENGEYSMSIERSELLSRIPEIYKSAVVGTPLESAVGSLCAVKPVLASESLSWFGISGIFFPFTCEPNINNKLPDICIAANALHEASHQAGFAREDEAGFLAYYIAVRSGNAEIEYSGVVHALIYCTNELYKADADMFGEVYERYSEGLQRDLKSVNVFWDAYSGETMEAAEAINNTYLKANQQEHGTKSYGRMVDLIIALYREKGTLSL